MDERTRLLFRCLKDENRHVRDAAIRGLQDSDDPEVFAAILDAYRTTRNASDSAVMTLMDTVSPNHVPLIVECLKEDRDMQLLAVGLLQRIATPEATEALVKVLSGNYDTMVKTDAMSGIAHHIQVYAQTGEHEEVVERAVRALCQFLSLPRSRERNEAYLNLLRVSAHIVPHLIKIAEETQEEEVRTAVILLLGRSGNESALSFILSLIQHPSDAVREAVVKAVGTYISRAVLTQETGGER